MRRRTLAPMAAWNAVTWGATAVYGIVATALIFRAVGKTEFGVWAVVGAIRGFLLLLDAGLATGISRDVALAEGGDRDAAGRVRASARVYAGLAGLALIAGVLGASFPGALLGLPPGVADVARTVTLLLAFETALALVAGPLPAILRGGQRFDALALSTSTQAALGVVLLVAMIDAFGLEGAAWATLIARAVVTAVLVVWMRRRRLIGERVAGDPRPSLPNVARFAAPLWIAALAAHLGLMTDLPIVGALFDADAAADFALGAKLPAAASGLLFAILASAFPQLVRLSASRLEHKVGALLFMACVLAGSGFTFLAVSGASFLQVWVGAAPSLSLTVLVIYCAAWACNAPAHVLSSVAMAKGRHQILAGVVIVESVVNLAASLALAGGAGWAAGPAAATLGTIAVSNLIVVPVVLLRRLELGVHCVVRPSLSGAALGAGGGLLAAGIGALATSPLATIVIGGSVLAVFVGITLDLTVRGESVVRRWSIVVRRGGLPVWWRNRRQSAREGARIAGERATAPIVWVKGEPPLVTVRIATYNRGPLVAERALASAAAQTHENLEILVVGDCCDPLTAEAVLAFDDPRVRFVNLPERGRYPEDPRMRWMVAGAAPMNHALQIARGEWLAPLDDDDEFTPDHVEALLDACRTRNLEFVWGKALMEERDGLWTPCGSWPLRHGQIVHASVLYSMRLRRFEHEAQAWRLDEPGDWNLWKRLRAAGVRMGFVDHVVCRHYTEQREVTPPKPVWLGAAPPAVGARLDDLGRDADRGAVVGQVRGDGGGTADDAPAADR